MAEITYRRHRFPPTIIQHAVWLYLRLTLSYRDVEELLAERGLDISYETVRCWVLKFGPVIARRLRRRRPGPSNRWCFERLTVSGRTVRRAGVPAPSVRRQLRRWLRSAPAGRGDHPVWRLADLRVVCEGGTGHGIERKRMMMAYAVLGRGILSAQVPKMEEMAPDDIRAQLPRFHSANLEKNLRLRSALEAIARAKNATLAQLSIAWPMAQGSRVGALIVPIPGAKSRKHLKENVRASDIVLTADDLAEIDRIVPPGAASGTRYPMGQMHRLNL
jgi:hypothetical protein